MPILGEVNEASLMMKKVSSRQLLNTRTFWALRDNRAEAEEETLMTKKHERERESLRLNAKMQSCLHALYRLEDILVCNNF